MNELNKRLKYHVSGAIERGEAEPITEVISDYERRVRTLESEGLTRSDAQAVVDAQTIVKVKVLPAIPSDLHKYEIVDVRTYAVVFTTDSHAEAWNYLISHPWTALLN